jgi:nucleoside-diphosphate-sugar epimerase
MLHTILGAGGAIGNNLLDVLIKNGEDIRLVSRKHRPAAGAESVEANVLDKDALAKALNGSGVVYLLIGIDYSASSWEHNWPIIMQNVIEACASQNIPLVFFDNVYMYGLVEGEMNEQTPFHPNSRKGKVRAQIANMLLEATSSGKLKSIIARSADFYGPHSAQVSFLHQLVIGRHMDGKKAQWMLNAKMPHTFTYAPDAARALYLLASDESAFGKTWHLPSTSPAPTGEDLIQLSAIICNAPREIQTISKWLLRLLGIFVPVLRESIEMLYQYENPYHFNSDAFQKKYNFNPTSYQQGIQETVDFYRNNS